MKHSKSISIYSLRDPIDGSPRFIGSTSRIHKLKKLHPHLWAIQLSPLVKVWINDLLLRGLRPTIKVEALALPFEASWKKQLIMQAFVNRGYELLNKKRSEAKSTRVQATKELWKSTLYRDSVRNGKKKFEVVLRKKQQDLLATIEPLDGCICPND